MGASGNKANFNNIRSKFILKKIFNNLEEKKALKIIKTNKTIRKRLNIDINNYKEYSEIKTLIEIDIKLKNNEYGKFINIKKEDEIYYHIYFNNNKEEIKRNYIKNGEKIKNIKIIIDYHIKSFEDLFKSCKSIESVDFKKFNRNNIDNMCGMFCVCTSLKELNIDKFKTNNITNMSFMFNGCMLLKELNLNNFNTNNVTNMERMFFVCESL